MEDPKMITDCSAEVDKKKTRLVNDATSTSRIVTAILQVIGDKEEWVEFNNHCILLCKRRAQLSKAIHAVVRIGMEYLSKAPTREIKLTLLQTLRTVSAGKIFAELERARMTAILADLYESDGDISQACDTLQEIQIETIGSMEKKEKTQFLLEQLRLCLDNKDFVRAEMMTQKVNLKILEEESFEEMKLKYYYLMIIYNKHNSEYFNICQAYHSIYKTLIRQIEQESPSKEEETMIEWKTALKYTVIFVILSPYDPESHDFILRLQQEESKLEELMTCQTTLKMFTTHELISTPISWFEEWIQDPIFTDEKEGEQRILDLRKRIVQHNLRTIARYYSRIRTSRLSELLQLNEDETELYLSEMVSSCSLYARVDRPEGIVSFDQSKNANEILNEWAGDIKELLGLVNATSDLINKEIMLHKK